MKVSSFFKNLDSVAEDFSVVFKTPDYKFIPFHFHVTEVATVHKKFRDCGNNYREDAYASIQIWIANDYDHRLTAGKLRKILLNTLLENEQDLDLIVESENDTVSLYNIESSEFVGKSIVFQLSKRKTECLAPDKCGVVAETVACCSTSCCC